MSRVGLRLRRGRDLALRWLAPGEVSAQWNDWNLYREIAWFDVLSGVSSTFVSVFALRLGASNFLMGLRTSLPALVNIILQIPAARLVEREGDREKVLLLSGCLMRIPVFLVALAPFLPERFQAAAVVCIMAVGTIPSAVGIISFTAVFADVVAPQNRAHVVSVRNASLSAATTIVVLVAGKVLDILPFPVSYQLIFILAFAFLLSGLELAAPPGRRLAVSPGKEAK